MTDLNTALQEWRLLRGYTVAPVIPAPEPVIESDPVSETAPETPAPEDAKKSASTSLKMPDLLGLDPAIWQRTYDAVFADTGDATKAYLAALGQVRRGQYGLATKSRKDGIEVYVSGWAVMFGDPRIKDSERQYFAPDTLFLLDMYPSAPLWWDHGDDPAYGSMPIGQRVKHEVHKYGIWLVHKLFMDHPLISRTLGALDNGEVSYSTDSIWHYVQRGIKPDGKLSTWALAGCSLTPSPAEIGLGSVISQSEPENSISEGESTGVVV